MYFGNMSVGGMDRTAIAASTQIAVTSNAKSTIDYDLSSVSRIIETPIASRQHKIDSETRGAMMTVSAAESEVEETRLPAVKSPSKKHILLMAAVDTDKSFNGPSI
jgi:hypothetical protein